MKIFTAKKEFDIFSVLAPMIFFVSAFVVFKLYYINFAPLFSLLVLYAYAKYARKIENLPSVLDLLLLVGLIIVVFLVISLTISPIVFKNLSIFTLNILKFSAYGIATIGFSMIVTLLFSNLEFSLIFSIFISILGATLEGEGLGVGVSLFCASLSSAILSIKLRRRSQIVRAGFYSTIVFFVAFILESSNNLFAMPSDFFAITLFMGFISSLITIMFLPILVIGVLHIFEYMFKVVTNISLLELSDFNNAVLKRMILEAPGTYQHSIVVANLSEAASESIDANSLLARVGAYYHDIGKLDKSEYFIENQIIQKNIHRDLKPSMSKLIIMNHVKEGVELAKKYKLNPRIIDFISQHHGRTLVYFFYHLAKESDSLDQVTNEEEYRYPGPKPQNKETAIVSLADTIEALSRTLDEPTPARIEEMVREVIRKRFMEGELDESGLTLKDLEKITQTFTRMLNALFHSRINYPREDDRNNKSTKDKEIKH